MAFLLRVAFCFSSRNLAARPRRGQDLQIVASFSDRDDFLRLRGHPRRYGRRRPSRVCGARRETPEVRKIEIY